MITQTTKLGGRLVKWALKKKDGRYIERGCNIHNTITKSCLNNLFEFNGPGSVIPNNNNDYLGSNLWVTASGTNNRYGVLNSCALGDGTGETSVNDTSLKNMRGAYTTTKKSGWCGTINDFANNICKIRIAHMHTITDNFTIKEIGWFNRIYPDGVHTMSARVQLDEFIDVEAGDTFYTIYELQIQLTLPYAVTLPILGKAVCNEKLRTLGNSDFTIPAIDSNGNGVVGVGNWGSVRMIPAYSIGLWGYGSDYSLNYSTLSNNNADNLITNTSWSNNYGVSPISHSVDSYQLDSFYRDYMIELAAPNLSVYAIGVNGCSMRFGEYDGNNNFIPNPFDGSKALRFNMRQRISTDLLTPSA